MVITLPSGFTATSLGGNGWTCVLASLACVRSDSLAAGASNTITAKVNVANGLPATRPVPSPCLAEEIRIPLTTSPAIQRSSGSSRPSLCYPRRILLCWGTQSH